MTDAARRTGLLLALTLALVTACSERRGTGPPPDGGLRDGGLADALPGTDGGDAGPEVRPLPDAGPGASVLVYAHSRDTLYAFDPGTLRVSEIGRFQDAGGVAAPFMLDLAVDEEGRVVTTSDEALFRVDPETAVVTHVGDFALGGERLFALTYLARGELRAEQVLVGATNEGVYYEVDPDSAATTRLGAYPDGWRSSGDLVSVEGLGTFATALRSDHPGDVLVRIGFAPGGSSTVTVVGAVEDDATTYRQVFGLGYWGRAVVGFTNAGQVLEIDRETGRATLLSGATGAGSFWGAGVTTRAPVLF